MGQLVTKWSVLFYIVCIINIYLISWLKHHRVCLAIVPFNIYINIQVNNLSLYNKTKSLSECCKTRWSDETLPSKSLLVVRVTMNLHRPPPDITKVHTLVDAMDESATKHSMDDQHGKPKPWKHLNPKQFQHNQSRVTGTSSCWLVPRIAGLCFPRDSTRFVGSWMRSYAPTNCRLLPTKWQSSATWSRVSSECRTLGWSINDWLPYVPCFWSSFHAERLSP